MQERAVYNSEDGKWCRDGDTPWVVRFVEKGQIVKPLMFTIADTYNEAFLQLFGHAAPTPAMVRGRRNVVLA